MTAPNKPPLVAMDVDGTLIDSYSFKHLDPEFPYESRPYAAETIQWHHAQGHEVHIWTAGGRDHALDAVDRLGCKEYVAECHAKPESPITRARAIEALGRLPILTYDDDLQETIIDKIYSPEQDQDIWVPVCPLVLIGDQCSEWATAKYYYTKACKLGSHVIQQCMSDLLMSINPEKASEITGQ